MKDIPPDFQVLYTSMLAVLLFCSSTLYVEFVILYFARSLFSIFLHAVVCVICKASLFHLFYNYFHYVQ